MTNFYKVSGCGNDFIALIEPKRPPTLEQIQAWCQRGISLGADGVFVLSRDSTSPNSVEMTHFNADGGEADLCVNGTRCAARLALHLGWAQDRVNMITGAGSIVGSRAQDERITLEIPFISKVPTRFQTRIDDSIVEGWLTCVGVPHLVLPWTESLSSAPVSSLGAALVGHPTVGPDGANINFVRAVEPHALEIRTYERGVNAETLACGSGALAAAQVMTATTDESKPPFSILTAGGERLDVNGEIISGLLQKTLLTGSASIIAHGTLSLEAEHLPSPARWSQEVEPSSTYC